MEKYNIVHMKEYYVWCLQEVSDSDIWKSVQAVDIKNARRFLKEENANFFQYQISGGTETGFCSISDCTDDMFFSSDEEADIQKSLGKSPSKILALTNSSNQNSARFSVAFAQTLQKICPEIAFSDVFFLNDPAKEKESVLFRGDIQNMRFVSK